MAEHEQPERGTRDTGASWDEVIGTPRSPASAPGSVPESTGDPSPRSATASAASQDDEQREADGSDVVTAKPDRDWMGVTAFVAGALLLSPVAIVLGHLGLNAANKGRARHRSFAVAGLILGYVGLVATAVGVWLLVSERVDPAQIDVQAQQDVTAVGAAAATHAVETGTMPQVEQTDAGYSVAGEIIEPHLETQHSLTFTGTSASDWCLDITYSGGDQTAVSYTATGGMAPGACAAQ